MSAKCFKKGATLSLFLETFAFKENIQEHAPE